MSGLWEGGPPPASVPSRWWNWDVDDAPPTKRLEDLHDPEQRRRAEEALAEKRRLREALD